MNPELNADDIGRELGLEGVGSVVTKVEAYCAHEERRLALTNQPKILALQAEIAILRDEARDLEERVRHAPPPGDPQTRRRRAAYYWAVTGILALAAFVFSLLAFDPYRLGWKSYLYSLGIAIVTPFLVEEVIERWNIERLVKALASIAFVAAILSLIFLAVIRGDLLAHEVRTTSSVIVSDTTDQAPEPQNDFYGKTLMMLQLAMVFLTVAMELGAGLALHRAWRVTGDVGEDQAALREELRITRGRMVGLLAEMAHLRNEPAIFVARFWRNFYRAMLTHTVRNAMTKLFLAMALFVLPVFHAQATAEEHVTIVVLLDLTQSVAGAGPDGQTDFQKNVEGVTRLLAQVPVSSRVTVLGITGNSFSQPYILLRARVPDDPGYFNEREQAARVELVRAWKHRSADLRPQFKYTDILGALLVASQLFDEAPKTSRKALVVFSDMRHHTRDLDMESLRTAPTFAAFEKRLRGRNAARLARVEVYALGVDAAGKTLEYWQSLKRFWTEYLEDCGASLRSYSILREPPALPK
jgi:hypothetical protein